jgi:hypothetical protein
MKTTQYMTLTVVAGLAFATHTTLAATDLDMLSKVDVLAIKKAQVVETTNSYFIDLDLLLQNKNTDAVKLRNGDFATTLETVEKPKEVKGKAKEEQEDPKEIRIPVGRAAVDEIEMPGSATNAGKTNKTVRVLVGDKTDDTRHTVLQLMNVLGDPTAPMTLALQGAAEVGLKLPRGWVFEHGKSYEVDLRFVPAFAREALLQ